MEFIYFLIRRVLWSLLVLIGLSITIFVIARVMPGDPARMALGPRASQEQVDDLRIKMGLDLPLLEQYQRFAIGLAHGDLGLSFLTKRPVNDDIRETFAATFELVLATIVIAFVAGVPLGVVGGDEQGRMDRQFRAAFDHIRRRHAELSFGASFAGPRRLCAAHPPDHGADHAGLAGHRQHHRPLSRRYAPEGRSRGLRRRAEASVFAGDRAFCGHHRPDRPHHARVDDRRRRNTTTSRPPAPSACRTACAFSSTCCAPLSCRR